MFIQQVEEVHCNIKNSMLMFIFWVLFLDPEAIETLSLGAIWNFSKGTGLSRVDIRLWGTRGLVSKSYLHRDRKSSNPC